MITNHSRSKRDLPFGSLYMTQALLKTATGNLNNEIFLLSLWEKLNLAKDMSHVQLGDVLGSIAATCCSVKLAAYVINAGASVNHRRSSKYLTPLHHAVVHNTPEAAELVKFLLGLGADPTAFATSIPKHGSKIRQLKDEAGAKDISKWLGVSWDDLVEMTKAKKTGEAARTEDENAEPAS